jgi:hypothetical protein
MFTRRRYLDRRHHYSREFLESLVSKLNAASFEKITVILPHNYPSVDPKNPEVEISDFFQRERNYAAVIFKAVSTEKKEMLKILFVNSNTRAVFADDTFPMAESEPSGVFFQSPDPARAYAFFEYFYEILSSRPFTKFILLCVASAVSFFLIVFESLSVAGHKQGIFAVRFGVTSLIDVIAVGIAIVVIFKFTAAPTGLWIKPKRELKLLYLANMALKGELRDNPIVQTIITIGGGLIVAYLAKQFGWL